jgi:hypothetical protein
MIASDAHTAATAPQVAPNGREELLPVHSRLADQPGQWTMCALYWNDVLLE